MSDSTDTRLGRIEVKLETILEKVSGVDSKVTIQNSRIDKLESWRDKWIGAAKVSGIITGIIGLALAAWKSL